MDQVAYVLERFHACIRIGAPVPSPARLPAPCCRSASGRSQTMRAVWKVAPPDGFWRSDAYDSRPSPLARSQRCPVQARCLRARQAAVSPKNEDFLTYALQLASKGEGKQPDTAFCPETGQNGPKTPT